MVGGEKKFGGVGLDERFFSEKERGSVICASTIDVIYRGVGGLRCGRGEGERGKRMEGEENEGKS